jgi:catechol 2,3-dioxygenase-like lactoylglutathione lyase family enzyme
MSVDDLDRSIRFYSTLFASAPTVVKPDYAKWMLEDPRVNFAISAHSGRPTGIDHLGIQVENGDELREVYGRLKEAEGPVLEEGNTTCCYAQSEKSWIADPSGVPWEAFHTTGESTAYGTSAPKGQLAGACCGPTADTIAKSGAKSGAKSAKACCG